MNNTAPKSKLLTKEFIVFFVLNFFQFSSFQVLIPVMPGYAQSLGGASGALGLMAVAVSLAALVFRPVAGKLSDSMDKRLLYLIGSAATIAVVMIHLFADNMGTLIALRILHGFCYSITGTVAMAMSSYIIPADRLGSGMGFMGLAGIISMGTSTTIALKLVDIYGYSAALYVSAFCSAVSIVLLAFTSKQPIAPKLSEKKEKFGFTAFLKSAVAMECIIPALIIAFLSAAYATVNNFISQYGIEKALADTGLYFTVYSISTVIVRPFIGKITDKYHIRATVYPTSAAMLGSLIVLYFAKTSLVVALAGALCGIGFGGMLPAIQAQCIKLVAPERRGAASGTFYIGLDIGNAGGPAVAGVIAASTGYANAFLIMGICCVVCMLLMLFSDRAEAKK